MAALSKCVQKVEDIWRSTVEEKLTKICNLLFNKLKTFINFTERNAKKILFAFIVVYTLVFSSYTILMHYAFKTYAWDLGIFTQVLWNTINTEKPFHYTLETHVNPSQNFFGTHFSPILLLVLPLYAIYQSPVTLLIFQSFIISLASLPLYWIAKNKLNSELWGLTFAAAFLLHPALHGMNCFDFHTQAFIPLFFLLTFHFLDTRQWLKGFICAVLTLSTVEFAPILVIFLGLYFFVREISKFSKKNFVSTIKSVIPSILLITSSISWFFLAFYIMYNINPLKSLGLPGNWDNWGSSMPEVILNVIKNPITALGTLANPIEKTYYFFSILAPTLFFVFLAPSELMLAVPWLFAALLSEYPPYYEFYFQYFGFIAGQIFISAIYGIKNFVKPNKKSSKTLELERKLMVLILIVSIILSLTISPIGLPVLTRRPVQITRHVKILHNVLSYIPSNASVATQNDIFPHLSQRENIFILTWPLPLEVDYIIVDLKSPHFLWTPAPSLPSLAESLSKVITTEKYGVMAYADGILLLNKNYSGDYVVKEPYKERFTYEKLWKDARTSSVKFDPSSQSGKIIIHQENHLNGTVWYGPYAYLYKGNYTGIFRMKTRSENINFTIDVVVWYSTEFEVFRKKLDFTDFIKIDEWKEFRLNFTVTDLAKIELRGKCESNNTYVALDFVEIEQLNNG
jgi:uncharacterized membrane protein